MPNVSALWGVPFITALSFMAVCLYTDIQTRRIPNLLTVGYACGGILYHSLVSGFPGGSLYSLKGLGLGCLLLLVPFVLKGMGGGDVKCLGALGAWMGPERIFSIFLYGALAGGLLALFLLLRKARGQGKRDLLIHLKTGFLFDRLWEKAAGNDGFPYTVPLAVGLIAFALGGRIVS